ncbi:hypothetical protein BURK1_03106 [Burkholderiales bacterium]|nr:hypothetical protein BURK1_03106 [Burkholderiales bacterium]
MSLSAIGPGAWLGIALVAAYLAWLGMFFARVRPCVMDALGRRLKVEVRESTNILDAGTYDIEGTGATLPKTGAVYAADLALLVVGTVGVAALVFIPAFLVAESGALLPLEGRITGRSVAMRAVGTATMASAPGKAKLGVEAVNDGREGLRQCRATVDGYTSRNGYLHGSSAWFDLATGERRAVEIALDAVNPPAGEHRFRVKVECANERLAVTDASLRVTASR